MPSTFCFLNQRQACRLASHLAYTCNSTEYRIKCTAEPYFHIYTHFHSDSENANKSNDYEQLHHTRILYITAVPRMAEYEKISAMIYGIYLKYVAPEDVHVYSIDECFIGCTSYLHFYEDKAKMTGESPAHIMAMTMIRDVLKNTGITATVGIGTNLYPAKVAMDIVAKKARADKDGVRIAALTEDSYKYLLWDHRPLTDFWQIGNGKAGRLERRVLNTALPMMDDSPSTGMEGSIQLIQTVLYHISDQMLPPPL